MRPLVVAVLLMLSVMVHIDGRMWIPNEPTQLSVLFAIIVMVTLIAVGVFLGVQQVSEKFRR